MRKSQLAVGLAIIVLLAVTVVGMVTAGPGPTDRAYELEQRLRCPACQSVSIAESPSETAQAMRRAVAEQVAAGRGDEEIIDYFRARYGAWVLLDPPTTGPTLLLWLLPLAGAAVGGVALLMLLRRRPDPREDLTVGRRERVDDAVARMRATTDGEDVP